MVVLKTMYKVTDNSGAKTAMSVTKNKQKIGDTLTVVIKSCHPNSIKVKTAQIYKALIVRSKINLVRPDLSILRFQENSIILLDKNFIPLANRIFGPIPLEIKLKNIKELNNKVENFV